MTATSSIQTNFETDSTIINHPGIDQKRLSEARKILEAGDAILYKPTRAGFTTSAVYAALEIKKRILFVAPTNRILKETVCAASMGNSVQVLPNCFCLRLRDHIMEDRFLSQLPLLLPKCDECVELKRCPVTKILADESPVIGITYRKLEALMLSKSKIAKAILNKISSVDAIVMDEAHEISLQKVVRVPAFYELGFTITYPNLANSFVKWRDLNSEFEEKINNLRRTGDAGHVGKHLSSTISNVDPLNVKQLIATYDELYELANHRTELDVAEKDILALRDILSILSGYVVGISYMRGPNEKNSKISLTGNYWISVRLLQKFLTDRVPFASHIYVSGTLIEPHPGFFSNLSGKQINEKIFHDINNTNSKMMIYSDKSKLNSQNFLEYLDGIIDEIITICKKNPGKMIFVVAPNAKKTRIIQERLFKAIGPSAPVVDYYRSDQTQGVENSARICIAVGLAELPSNTYDHQARGENEEERWIDSQRLRRESVDAATWQTWSRVKDPEGKEESIVYCIGVRAEQINGVISWGPGRKLELVKIKPWKLPKGITGRTPIFKVTVKDLIEPPMVSAELKTSARRDRHNAGEYVERVQNYDGNLIISEFLDKPPILSNRGNVRKLGIYNNPPDKDEVCTTSLSLTLLIATRFDCYAIQNKTPDKNGKYGYIRHRANFLENPYLMEYHVKGQFTLGFYQIGLDDTLRWICFDIDDHKGERGPDAVRAELHKLFDVLTKYGIPFLLEASGSPNSYHIWILLRPTKTYNAYIFSRQIVDEAGIKCEIFPKQSCLDKNSKYGNLVKVPLGINRKTGIRSQFLDPVTFEPYLGLVPIPGIVHLLEVPEPEGRHEKSKKGGAKRSNSGQEMSTRAPTKIGQYLRPCLKDILAAKTPLEGSEGHEIRVAIAAEARNVGYTIEQTIELFKDQPDFNLDITRKNVEYIYTNGYLPYSCNTLRGKCNSLITPYCIKCPKNELIHWKASTQS